MQRDAEDGKTIGWAVNMTASNEEEFIQAFKKISEVEGVEWVGCPAEEETYYSDLIAYIPKGEYLVSELQDEARRIAEECKQLLRQ